MEGGKENYHGSWVNKFMKHNWNDIIDHNNIVEKDLDVVKNPNRLITCLNNLIGFAYNIGHYY
jgi:hypothetical protein